MAVIDTINKAFIITGNVPMTATQVCDVIEEKICRWDDRIRKQKRKEVNRDLSSRYASNFNKDTSNKKNIYTMKEEVFNQYIVKENNVHEFERVKDISRIKTKRGKIRRGVYYLGKGKRYLVEVRVNQDVFREKLIELDCKCKICGLDKPELLLASHTKDWKNSNEVERVDVYNGFLFCPNHDKLYDKYLITFKNDGNIIISKSINDKEKSLLGIEDNIKIEIQEKHKKYLEYHRKRFYEKENNRGVGR